MSTRRNERGKLWVGASMGFRKREVGGKGRRGCECGCVFVLEMRTEQRRAQTWIVLTFSAAKPMSWSCCDKEELIAERN
jgi:hypothetical protein